LLPDLIEDLRVNGDGRIDENMQNMYNAFFVKNRNGNNNRGMLN